MQRPCATCGKPYTVRQLHFDDGNCPQCRLPFLVRYRDLPETRARTRQVIKNSAIVHGLILCLTSLFPLCCGEAATPGVLYTLTVLCYVPLRMMCSPNLILRRRQQVLIDLLPFYAMPLFYALFYLGQYLRYGPP